MVAPDVKEFTAVVAETLFPLDQELSERLMREFPEEGQIQASSLAYLVSERGYVIIDTNGEIDYHVTTLSRDAQRLLLRVDALAAKAHLYGQLEGRELYMFVRLCSVIAAMAVSDDIEHAVRELDRAEKYLEEVNG